MPCTSLTGVNFSKNGNSRHNCTLIHYYIEHYCFDYKQDINIDRSKIVNQGTCTKQWNKSFPLSYLLSNVKIIQNWSNK